MKWGYEHNTVRVDDRPYLSRWILHFGIGSVRLHKFWRGDKARASHDHPFAYWTFPFTSYVEKAYDVNDPTHTVFKIKVVDRWRWTYRPAAHRHVVRGRSGGCCKPWWTLMLTGKHNDDWYFYPEIGERVHWREWAGG